MGASRKLQGEIDRVLKKVQEGVDVFDSIWNKVYDTDNANQKEKFEADLKKEIKKLQRYRDQIKTWIQSSEIKDKKALMDSRKLIEREMERFKVCEKETKTKAFSKEGLGQQPKTDPKEKAKSETRDWLNNVVGDLESQIDNFEAEVEGLSVKKGRARQPRLTHLETSISRHKAHIMKLELILRLLDNDELSPEEVNDVRDFIEDYVERNQDNLEEFEDVDDLYSSLPLDKVEVLEDLVALGPSVLSKAAVPSTTQQNTTEDQNEETASHDGSSDIMPKTPPAKTGDVGPLVPAISPSISMETPAGPNAASTSNASVNPLVVGQTVASLISAPVAVRIATENSAAAVTSSVVNSPSSVKEEENSVYPVRRSSPAIPEIGLGRGISRGISNQVPISSPMSGISSNGALGSVPTVSDMTKRNFLNAEERMGSGSLNPPLVSPLSNRMLLQQDAKSSDGTSSNDFNSVGVGDGRVFSSAVPAGVQWRPPSTTTFQNQNETTGQFRGRPEIAPDQREKFLQRLQQVQQGHNTLLSVPHLQGANLMQFPMQQHNSLLQQFNSQSSTLSPQLGLGLNIQPSGLSPVTSGQLQTPVHQQSSPHPLMSSGPMDADVGLPKGDEKRQQQQQNLFDDLNVESATNSSLNKIIGEDDLKSSYTVTGSVTMTDGNQLPRDTDFSPGQPLQPSQSSASLGVIGRRSVSDLGAIGDNLSGGSAVNSSGMHDQIYNTQMLEAAFYRLPQPKDSERAKSYVPRHPAVTPASFPQNQAAIVENPDFWERLGSDPMGFDALFFAFYYQQNTYQQYLAARELKRQSWRYHRKYNTWFQRHEEPNITNDEFEKGTYVYFDFHITDDNNGQHQGWCQRIKTEFIFEYNYLEDEL